MKKILLGKCAAACMLTFGVFHLPGTAAAQDATDECSKELLLSYFPAQFVKQTLSKFNVPQDKWDAINNALASKDREVIKTVEEKASAINPNPLKDPQQRHAAVKIFRETLLQIFSEAMKANGITDEGQIQAMLDDVQQQKAKRFAECMEQRRQQSPSSQPDSSGASRYQNNSRTSYNENNDSNQELVQETVEDTESDEQTDGNVEEESQTSKHEEVE